MEDGDSVLTDSVIIFDKWQELNSLLVCAMPSANVNFLYSESSLQESGNMKTAKALEIRPSFRLFENSVVLPAKWTIIVFESHPGRLSVNVLKLDRQVVEQSEFGSSQTLELVEFLKCHPFLTSKWTYCRGFQDNESISASPDYEGNSINDLFCGKSVKRSECCELLLREETNVSGKCKFCADSGEYTNETTSEPLPLECEVFLEPTQNCEKPDKTWAQLIAEALMQAVDGMLTPSGIYSYISHKYPYYDINLHSWKSTVRTTLRKNPIFQKGPKSEEHGRVDLWMVDRDAKEKSSDQDCANGVSSKKPPQSELPDSSKSGSEAITDPDVKSEVKEEPDYNSEIRDHSPQDDDAVRREHPESKVSTSCLGKPNRDTNETTKKPSSGHLLSKKVRNYKYIPRNTCIFCNEKFPSRNLLNSHLSSIHEDEPTLKFRSFYRHHIAANGGQTTSIETECKLCDLIFFQVSRWVQHMQRHKGDTKVVHIPDLEEYRNIKKLWKRKQGLDYYHKTNRADKDKQSFICDICGKRLSRTSKYRHMQEFHKSGPEKNYKCGWESCDFATNNEQSLKNHIMIHKNEKPYVCPHCGRAFRRTMQLNECLRRCTGVGLFKCSKCGKTFTKRENLVNHERQHEGIRPFACNLCSCTYVCKKNLAGHMKRVHK